RAADRAGVLLVVAAAAEQQDQDDGDRDAKAGDQQDAAQLGGALLLAAGGAARLQRLARLAELRRPLAGDLRQAGGRQLAQLRGHDARPGSPGGRALEEAVRRGVLALVLLT